MGFKITVGNGFDHDYLSYNWNDLAEICTKHLSTEECDDNCTKIHLWHIRDDLDGFTGNDVAEYAHQALTTLARLGIHPREGNLNNPQWEHGVYTVQTNPWIVEKMPVFERLEIFAWHIQRFMRKGLAHPDRIFNYD